MLDFVTTRQLGKVAGGSISTFGEAIAIALLFQEILLQLYSSTTLHMYFLYLIKFFGLHISILSNILSAVWS